MIIWLKVSQDEYELPEAVADSARQLAKLVGCTERNVLTSLSKWKTGKYKTCKYRKVIVKDED